eukprot:superscaffoldBa00001165_g9295
MLTLCEVGFKSADGVSENFRPSKCPEYPPPSVFCLSAIEEKSIASSTVNAVEYPLAIVSAPPMAPPGQPASASEQSGVYQRLPPEFGSGEDGMACQQS